MRRPDWVGGRVADPLTGEGPDRRQWKGESFHNESGEPCEHGRIRPWGQDERGLHPQQGGGGPGNRSGTDYSGSPGASIQERRSGSHRSRGGTAITVDEPTFGEPGPRRDRREPAPRPTDRGEPKKGRSYRRRNAGEAGASGPEPAGPNYAPVRTLPARPLLVAEPGCPAFKPNSPDQPLSWGSEGSNGRAPASLRVDGVSQQGAGQCAGGARRRARSSDGGDRHAHSMCARYRPPGGPLDCRAIPRSIATSAGGRGRTADLFGVRPHAWGPGSVHQQQGRRCLLWADAGATPIGQPGPTVKNHQGWRRVPAPAPRPVGPLHPWALRARLRSSPMGARACRLGRQERQAPGGGRGGPEAGCLAAPALAHGGGVPAASGRTGSLTTRSFSRRRMPGRLRTTHGAIEPAAEISSARPLKEASMHRAFRTGPSRVRMEVWRAWWRRRTRGWTWGIGALAWREAHLPRAGKGVLRRSFLAPLPDSRQPRCEAIEAQFQEKRPAVALRLTFLLMEVSCTCRPAGA